MKRQHILFIIFSIIIILAIVYLYLNSQQCKSNANIEGFNVKNDFAKITPTFIDQSVTMSTEQPKNIVNGIITPGYYQYSNKEEMRLPTDYVTVSYTPYDKSKVPPGYYIALLGENPVIAKLPDNVNRLTLGPYVSPTGELPYKLPNGYYVVSVNNSDKTAKLPDYNTVLTLLPKEDQAIPEGYYAANLNGERVLAKLPDSLDMLTLPPFDESKVPIGYYIAQYKAIPNIMKKEEEDAIQPKNKLAKLPYGYKLNYKLAQVFNSDGSAVKDTYGNLKYELKRDSRGFYTYEVEDKVVSVTDPKDTTKKIEIRYTATRPMPSTDSTKETEMKKMRNDINDYFGNVVVDRVYEKDYDRTNYDATKILNYHDSPEQIVKNIDNSALAGSASQFGSMTVIGADGKMVEVPYVNGQALPTYYQPGSYTYGTTYVPSYEDSVYLSKTSGLSTLGKMYPTASTLGGMCNTKTSMEEMEKKCNAIPADQCASMSCCVLLGGNKCVYGNELGPKLKANYTDKFIKNKDVYYYQGKCYGNCV